jgi:hypothetical protein
MEVPVTLDEIRTEVMAIALEPSYDDSDYDRWINSAIQEVAGRVIIPDLKRINVISTSTTYAYVTLTTLTDGFAGMLRRVRRTVSGDDVGIYAKLEELYDEYTTWNEAGDVEAVALEGNYLWYQKLPAVAQSLTVMYTAVPPTLTLDADVPIFPSHLHRKLCVHGAAKMIWDLVETDIEKPKTQTLVNETHFENGITQYREFLARSKRHNITSTWSY